MKNLSLAVSAALFLGSSVMAAGLPKQSVQAIIRALQDTNLEVRVAAAQALIQVPDDAAAKPLETALIASADATEQDVLSRALIATEDKNTVKRLMDALTNPQFTWGAGAKAKAVAVIGVMGEKKSVKWLTDLLVSGDGDPAVKAAALRALGAIGAPPKKEEKK